MLSVKDAFHCNGKKEFLRLITNPLMLVSFLPVGHQLLQIRHPLGLDAMLGYLLK